MRIAFICWLIQRPDVCYFTNIHNLSLYRAFKYNADAHKTRPFLLIHVGWCRHPWTLPCARGVSARNNCMQLIYRMIKEIFVISQYFWKILARKLTEFIADLPTGRLLSYFATESAVTSMTFSPTGEFLATTHVDMLGVYLWSNLSMYDIFRTLW